MTSETEIAAREAAAALVDDYERRVSTALLERDWLVEQIAAYGAAREAAVLAAAKQAIAEADYGFNGLWAFDGYTPEDAAGEAAANVRKNALAALNAYCATPAPAPAEASARGEPRCPWTVPHRHCDEGCGGDTWPHVHAAIPAPRSLRHDLAPAEAWSDGGLDHTPAERAAGRCGAEVGAAEEAAAARAARAGSGEEA